MTNEDVIARQEGDFSVKTPEMRFEGSDKLQAASYKARVGLDVH